ncbi:N-acetylmuramoyl-L-alanine amidase, partial [Streptomyces sp. NPDC005921]
DRVIIHVTQQSYAGTLSIFQNPKKRVSAHYLVRSADGHVAQCVRESDIAWHAGNWDYNTRSVGIEHEGWVDKPEYFTDALYQESARLTASICDRYGIPKDRDHIIGHVEVPGTDHTDPGKHWDWVRYMSLVGLSSSK